MGKGVGVHLISDLCAHFLCSFRLVIHQQQQVNYAFFPMFFPLYLQCSPCASVRLVAYLNVSLHLTNRASLKRRDRKWVVCGGDSSLEGLSGIPLLPFQIPLTLPELLFSRSPSFCPIHPLLPSSQCPQQRL